MREFRKTPKLRGWKKFWHQLIAMFYPANRFPTQNGSHHERMKARRRKTKFHRW